MRGLASCQRTRVRIEERRRASPASRARRAVGELEADSRVRLINFRGGFDFAGATLQTTVSCLREEKSTAAPRHTAAQKMATPDEFGKLSRPLTHTRICQALSSVPCTVLSQSASHPTVLSQSACHERERACEREGCEYRGGGLHTRPGCVLRILAVKRFHQAWTWRLPPSAKALV